MSATGPASDGPATDRRVVVIRNANAGSKGGIPTNGISDAQLDAVLAILGCPLEVVVSGSEDEARQATRAAVAAGCDMVVAAGGDGTAGTIAAELLGTRTALGILPLGSVMNIARSLGLPREVEAAAAVLAGGHVRTIDVGDAGDRPFFEAASIGLNAALFREAQRFDDGDWSSVIRTIWVAIRYRPARIELELDDQVVRTRALMVTVANGPYTGVGMRVAPDARLDDGCFDVRVFRGFSKFELLRHLAGIAFGRYRYAPRVSTYRSRRVRATSASPLPARADAVDLGTTPVEFAVRPAALRVVVPAPSG